jgi:hypothetical protein
VRIHAVVLGEQLFVETVHPAFHAFGGLHQRDGALGVALAESRPRRGENFDGVICQAVDADGKSLGQWPFELQGLAADGHRVVADALQHDVDSYG